METSILCSKLKNTENYVPYHHLISISFRATLQSIRGAIAPGFLMMMLALVGYSTTVSAGHGGLPNCKNGHVCLYKDINYDGGMASYGGNDADYTNGWWPDNVWDVVNHGRIGSINDEISSIKNRGNRCSTTHFWDKNYRKNPFFLKRRWDSPNLNGHSNKYTSHLWC